MLLNPKYQYKAGDFQKTSCHKEQGEENGDCFLEV